MFRLPPLTPFVRSFLIALVALFVTFAVLENFLDLPVVNLLRLETRALSVLTPVQLFTHVLVVPAQANPVLWLMISVFFLWMFLASFEERYGMVRVIQLIVVSALAAGIPALLVGLVLPNWAAPIAGPGTITQAAIAAYCALQSPYSQLSFFGVPMQARHLIWLLVGLSAIGFVVTKNAGQLAADLGAIGGGIAFVSYWIRRPPPRRSVKRGSPKLHVVRGKDEDEPGRWLN